MGHPITYDGARRRASGNDGCFASQRYTAESMLIDGFLFAGAGVRMFRPEEGLNKGIHRARAEALGGREGSSGQFCYLMSRSMATWQAIRPFRDTK